MVKKPVPTPEDIFAILRSIVIHYPDNDCCYGLDTFAEITHPDQIVSENFGKTFQDYEDGKFYSKEWVDSGADDSKIKGGWGRLLVDQTTMQMSTSCTAKNDTDTWWIVIALHKKCPTCNKEYTESALVAQLRKMVKNVWNEFKKYCLYENLDKTDKDGNFETYWLTPKHVEVLNQCEGWDLVPTRCKSKICDWIVQGVVNVGDAKKEYSNNSCSMLFSFSTKGCLEEAIKMNYKKDEIKPSHLARARCSVCN